MPASGSAERIRGGQHVHPGGFEVDVVVKAVRDDVAQADADRVAAALVGQRAGEDALDLDDVVQSP